jgi:hypothetical protein
LETLKHTQSVLAGLVGLPVHLVLVVLELLVQRRILEQTYLVLAGVGVGSVLRPPLVEEVVVAR